MPVSGGGPLHPDQILHNLLKIEAGRGKATINLQNVNWEMPLGLTDQEGQQAYVQRIRPWEGASPRTFTDIASQGSLLLMKMHPKTAYMNGQQHQKMRIESIAHSAIQSRREPKINCGNPLRKLRWHLGRLVKNGK